MIFPPPKVDIEIQGDMLVMQISKTPYDLTICPFDLEGAERHLKVFAAHLERLKLERGIRKAIILETGR